jgi:hypothetical protein
VRIRRSVEPTLVVSGIYYHFIRAYAVDAISLLGYPADITFRIPNHRVGGATLPVGGVLAAEVPDVLIVIALAGLALFSILSILLSSEDGREPGHPIAGPATWILLLRR